MTLNRNLDIPAAGVRPGTLRIRGLAFADAAPLDAAYRRNAEHLAPWEPERKPEFFSEAGQRSVIESKLMLQTAGSEVPWVVVEEDRIIGMITLTGIVRGPFLSAHLGYWIDEASTGGGIASSSVQAVLSIARDELGLHRIQAATLLHNVASQTVLERSGFEQIGMAPAYLQIAGIWQDHALYQRILY
ncbi:GNAT family N-acetyltransferase [Paenarthrobacter sp. NPDC092416]|uniref:GNAT family N-acetyltransferase n=1 Tax=Paenarthrobacter sp. NPDC092416 TaxID=3364386 RepID=UPI0038269879